MKPLRLTRDTLAQHHGDGVVLTEDVRGADGRVLAAKGVRLTPQLSERLLTVPWSELHAVMLGPGDVHELAAGERLARAAAGPHVTVDAMTAGHWPLHAAARGLLRVDVTRLRALNGLDGLVLYTVFDGQVVDARETVARAKVIPFAVAARTVAEAERIAADGAPLLEVRPFQPRRVGAVIQESLGDRATARAHAVLAEKMRWFGATLLPPRFTAGDGATLAAAMRDQFAAGADVLIVAGSRPMDPLDPMYDALDRAGVHLERQGIPAHPGSLLWLGYTTDAAARTVVGLPSCGLFTQASVFDLVMPRILCGERLTAGTLAEFGHGGLLTRDMAFRFPPYRQDSMRGEVLAE